MYQNVEKRIKTVASKSLILTSDMNWKDTQTDDISSKYKVAIINNSLVFHSFILTVFLHIIKTTLMISGP